MTQDWLDNFNALAKAPTGKTKTASASSTPSAFRAAWVRGDNTAVFGRAAPDAPKLNDLAKDLPVKVIGSKGEWLMIESPIGLDVWVYGNFISETGNTAQINNNRVRIRSLPSTGPESDVLGLLDKGTPVEIKSRQGDWINHVIDISDQTLPPKPELEHVLQRKSLRTNHRGGELDFHTDTTDVFALFCLRPA